MDIHIPDPNEVAPSNQVDLEEEEKKEKRKRGCLLFLLMFLLLLLCCSGGMFGRYVWQPEPLPDMVALPVDINYPPHYLYSIYGADKPVGVTLSPQGDRIYVAETGGERLVKIFDREGNLLDSFAPPRTSPGQRSPVYLTSDSLGRVFVADRSQHAVFVYDYQGGYLDTILSPDLTLSEYVAKHVKNLPAEAVFAYNIFEQEVYYQLQAGQTEEVLPAPDRAAWSPLGVRIDDNGKLLLTDVATKDFSAIREIPSDLIMAASWREFNPPQRQFGAYGPENGQFIFPNVAVTDSLGRIYVTDGNNGRISAWNVQNGQVDFRFNFGRGSGDEALSLPRGATIDAHDRLYVVDAVGQNIKVYDVSEDEPFFLFSFGEWGARDGQFDFPGDIILDNSGYLYITDRENNRIQVWAY